jgi:hypothetical protein
MATLVGTDRNGICIFLDRSPHDVIDTAIVTKVYDFSAARLNETPHNIYSCIVPIKQGGRRDEAKWGQGWFAGYSRQIVDDAAHRAGSSDDFSPENTAE